MATVNFPSKFTHSYSLGSIYPTGQQEAASRNPWIVVSRSTRKRKLSLPEHPKIGYPMASQRGHALIKAMARENRYLSRKIKDAITRNDPLHLAEILKHLEWNHCRALINTPDKDGNTPLMQCCYYEDNQCASVLLKAKANLLTFNHAMDTPLDIALSEKNWPLVKILKKTEPKLEGVFSLSLLGHVFGFEPRPIFFGKKLNLSGGYGIVMHKQIQADLQRSSVRNRFFSLYTQTQFEELVEAYAKSDLSTDTANEIRQRIQSGRLVIISCGWTQHVINLVFLDGYLVICNRGEGSLTRTGIERTFVARKIQLNQFSSALMNTIIKIKKRSLQEGIKFYYAELLWRLRATEDEFCREICAIAPSASKAGVCAYAAAKAALRAAGALLTKNPMFARDSSKAWSIGHREWTLNYFKSSPSPFRKKTFKSFVVIQTKRLKKREEEQFLKMLLRLKTAIQKHQSLDDVLTTIENFCGRKYRQNLEESLVSVCEDQMEISDTNFGRKMFLDRNFNAALKMQAVDVLIDRLDVSK